MTSTRARRLFGVSTLATIGGLMVTITGVISAAYPADDASRRLAGQMIPAGLLATGAASAAAAAAAAAMASADRREYLAACDQHRRTMAAIRASL
jgi:hypothetical protein